MRVAIVADAFPPLRTSGAVQIRDLSLEFLSQGHEPTILTPSSALEDPWVLEDYHGVEVLRLRSPRAKDIGHARRAVSESIMSFSMLWNLHRSPLRNRVWDGVVWYSPTIFLGPFVDRIKRRSQCKSYLILRDIFPDWALDMGILRPGLAYRYLKAVERYQYSVADVIGVQSAGNLAYLRRWSAVPGRRLEVLHNWLNPSVPTGCSIDLSTTSLVGRTIFMYAGNMGVAQGLRVFLDVAETLKSRNDIGFLFVGRGSEVSNLQNVARSRQLDNVLFYDEIPPEEIASLYSQGHVGLVALDLRHRTHNIPGKFLSYLQFGLPVLALVNPGNDLVRVIEDESVGQVATECTVDVITMKLDLVLEQLRSDPALSTRCQNLFRKLFSTKEAVKMLTEALSR